MKVLVSVWNISGYLISELKELAEVAEVCVIECPCGIRKGVLADKVRWINRLKLTGKREVLTALGDFSPDIFLCSGWADKLMLNLAWLLKHQGCRTVMTIDTPWKGTMKQYINCGINRFWLPHLFDYGWGAGVPQANYLRNLGFRTTQIRTGMYCADTKKFSALYQSGRSVLPHQFLYVGRYVPVKNMRRMERAFVSSLNMAPGSDWSMTCIGSGELWEERTIHPKIHHLGYVDPSRLQDHVGNSGCFVLPSIYEPWGVVIHEFAIMGLPLLCSDRVQSASEFLKEGDNGYTFDPLDETSIRNAMLKVMSASDSELCRMGESSRRLGMSRTTKDWVDQIVTFMR